MYDELIKNLRDYAEVYKLTDNENTLEYSLLIKAADAIEELVRKEKFHTFLWNVINPNEMEQYIEMYNSKGIPVCGAPEPPMEET